MAIHLTRIDELALVTLDRPEVLNALNFELLRDLGAALDQVAGGDARALLVTGAGDRAFCAGADIKELMGRSTQATRGGAAFGQAIDERLGSLNRGESVDGEEVMARLIAEIDEPTPVRGIR